MKKKHLIWLAGFILAFILVSAIAKESPDNARAVAGLLLLVSFIVLLVQTIIKRRRRGYELPDLPNLPWWLRSLLALVLLIVLGAVIWHTSRPEPPHQQTFEEAMKAAQKWKNENFPHATATPRNH